MKKITVFFLGVLFLMVSMIGHGEGFSISVTPNIPDNQQGDSRSMYNIRMNPSETKTYKLIIHNSGEIEKKVEVMIVNASTLAEGVIDKSDPKARMVKGAKNKLTDLTTLNENEVIVRADSSREVRFTITAPKEEIQGIVLGGIYVIDKNESLESEDKQDGGMSIHNQMGYPVEIMLSTSKKQVKAKLDLEEVKVGQYGGHPSLEVPIQNINSNIIPDLKVQTKIYKKGSTKLLIEKTKGDNQLAPQAIFPYQVQLSENKLLPGKYQAYIKATSEYGEWEWNRDFTVTNDEAKKINERTIQEPLSYLKYYLIGGGIVIFLIIIYLIIKVRKLSKKVNE